MTLKDFLKEYWYWLLMGFLTLVLLILYIIGFFIKVKKLPDTSLPPISNTGNNAFITDINCNSNTQSNPDNNYCSSGYTRIPIKSATQEYIYLNQPGGFAPYNQICYSSPLSVSNSDTAVVDVSVVDMTSSSGNYISRDLRCGGDFFAPASINLPNLDLNDVGKVLNNGQGCRKMGLCVKTQQISSIKSNKSKYIPVNGLMFVVGNKGDNPQYLCTIIAGTDYVTDGTDLYSGCGNKSIYLCKKFIQ